MNQNRNKYNYSINREESINSINNSCAPYNYKYSPSILPARERIVVFGDIHGDLQLAIQMLTSSGVAKIDIKNNIIQWIGGTTCVVQVGDQVDRCRPMPGTTCAQKNTTPNDEASDILIMEMFNELGIQAERIGGKVISLLGNHELMNSMGYLDYVSYKGLEQFENYKDPSNPQKIFSSGREARAYAFKPGKTYGKMMGCTRYATVIIGSNLFVHAGIVNALIKEINITGMKDFETININIKRWLIGLLDEKYVNHIVKYSDNSMFWSRILGKIPAGVTLDDPRCMDNIKGVLDLFQIGSMIIGHTPQSFLYNNDINSTCNDKIWRVDNGSSHAFDIFDDNLTNTKTPHVNRRMQYLEIINDTNYFVCDINGCKRSISNLSSRSKSNSKSKTKNK